METAAATQWYQNNSYDLLVSQPECVQNRTPNAKRGSLATICQNQGWR